MCGEYTEISNCVYLQPLHLLLCCELDLKNNICKPCKLIILIISVIWTRKKKYITHGNIFYTRGNISRIIIHLGKGKKDVTFEGE